MTHIVLYQYSTIIEKVKTNYLVGGKKEAGWQEIIIASTAKQSMHTRKGWLATTPDGVSQ